MSSSIEKGAFILSIAVLTFLGGYVVRWQGWFPSTQIERAYRQASLYIGEWASIDKQDRVYDRKGTRSPRPSQIQPGLTLITSHWAWEKGSDTVKPGAKLINRNGQVLHEWHPEVEQLFEQFNTKTKVPAKSDFDGSYLFPNGDLLLVLEYVGAVRLNSCGEVVWRVKEGNHHYLSRAEDGSFWIPGASTKRLKTTDQHPNGFPGIQKPVWMDRIVNITADGEVRQRITVLDVLYKNDLERHIIKGHSLESEGLHPDLVHLNDIEPLPSSMADEYPLFEAGDLAVSLRRPSLVFVFDPDSGVVKWHASHPFLHQHDPDFTGEGWIGIFDNNYDMTKRGTMLGGSRIVSIQPHTDSMRVRFPTKHSEPFYTSTQGQWQELANGNMLLVERDAGRVVEVGPDGRTVWEWVHPYSSDSKVPIVSGAHRYDLTRADVADWSCTADSIQSAGS